MDCDSIPSTSVGSLCCGQPYHCIRSLRRDRLIVGQREERAGRGNGEAGIAPDTQRAELGVYCAFQSRAGYKTEKGYFFQGSLLKELSFSSSTPPACIADTLSIVAFLTTYDILLAT